MRRIYRHCALWLGWPRPTRAVKSAAWDNLHTIVNYTVDAAEIEVLADMANYIIEIKGLIAIDTRIREIH